MNRLTALSLAAAALSLAAPLIAEDAPTPAARPTFDADGTVHVPAFDLPPSPLLSPEALAAQKMRARMSGMVPPSNIPVEMMRKGLAAMLAPQIAGMQKQYPVDIVEGTVGGIPVRTVTPKGKAWDQKRVLINVHGGGFSMCWESCSLLESIPIASVGGYKVVSVNYRMGPEAKHPAAREDTTAVYKELLKRYKPSQIGLYGCSAGGAISAEMGAWLPAHGLPQHGQEAGGRGLAGLLGASGFANRWPHWAQSTTQSLCWHSASARKCAKGH